MSSRQERIARFRTVEERHAGVSITLAKPASLPQWQERWITPLWNLMIFANRERSVLTALSGFVEADTLHGAVRIFERQETTIDPETSFSNGTCCPSGIMDDPVALIGAWIDLHSRLGASTAFLFGTLNASRLPVENEFLNLMAFAEAYHRVLHNEPPLEAEIILAIASRCSPLSRTTTR